MSPKLKSRKKTSVPFHAATPRSSAGLCNVSSTGRARMGISATRNSTRRMRSMRRRKVMALSQHVDAQQVAPRGVAEGTAAVQERVVVGDEQVAVTPGMRKADGRVAQPAGEVGDQRALVGAAHLQRHWI